MLEVVHVTIVQMPSCSNMSRRGSRSMAGSRGLREGRWGAGWPAGGRTSPSDTMCWQVLFLRMARPEAVLSEGGCAGSLDFSGSEKPCGRGAGQGLPAAAHTPSNLAARPPWPPGPLPSQTRAAPPDTFHDVKELPSDVTGWQGPSAVLCD